MQGSDAIINHAALQALFHFFQGCDQKTTESCTFGAKIQSCLLLGLPVVPGRENLP